jgi:hypothetical protein
MHSVVTRGPGSLRIVIPARRHWLKVALVCCWLVGWALAERAAVLLFMAEPAAYRPPGFAMVCVGSWTLGGMLALLLLVWLIWGREVVTITADALAIRNEISGAGRNRLFEMVYVERFRLRQSRPFLERHMLEPGFAKAGWIEFDYRFRTYRFGTQIDRPEARVLIGMIAEIVPGRTESVPQA